eukprot:scaffold2358_cov309-Prasinococcus_capsulatus_cf.AAC.1
MHACARSLARSYMPFGWTACGLGEGRWRPASSGDPAGPSVTRRRRARSRAIVAAPEEGNSAAVG